MKKKVFKKKIFKGMTLVEIIISIAVLAIMTTVLVAASSSIQNYLRAAGDMNDRVAVQAPVAQAGDNVAGTYLDKIHINILPSTNDPSMTIPLEGELYQVYKDNEMSDHSDEAGRNLNMKFINNIQTTTDAPKGSTPATTAAAMPTVEVTE
jgi:prepilin-type N-terminal cleavage/methylation domain-containing protein